MESEEPRATGGSAGAQGSGAAATAGGIAAGAAGNAAGRDVNENCVIHNHYQFEVRRYMRNKGPDAYSGMADPAQPWDYRLDGCMEVSALKDMLLSGPPECVGQIRRQPKLVQVHGLLYPCALLVSGWWESQLEKIEGTQWHNGIQEWLFRGFHAWGPSWDFTWDFEQAENAPAVPAKPYAIAQLGDGDEANSIPVIIPADKARKLRGKFQERGREMHMAVGGFLSTVTGILCHRSSCPEAARLGLVGGILDYCIWLQPAEAGHKISLDRNKPDIYSGYLWKCLAPKAWVDQDKPLGLNQVYFVWEHTNFADENSIHYNLDSLAHKEAYIGKQHDNAELVLLQKSSMLIPGEPKWNKQEFYDFFLHREEDI
jgi:hypothetical protein